MANKMRVRLTRLKINQRNVDNLVNAPGVQRDVHDRGERMHNQARAIAPVATGEYRDNLHLEDGPDGSVRLVSDVDHTFVVEADHGVLARSLDAAGGS